MLIAQTSEGQWVNAATIKRDESVKLLCPGCKKPVILKKGTIKLAHFAHQQAVCTSFSEGETLEHLSHKKWLQEWSQTGILEAYLPALKQRPDLLWEQIPIEIQCSVLSLERLTARVTNYRQQGYHSWWLLGRKLYPKKRWSKLQKACSGFTTGKGSYLWTIHPQEIRLLYHVRQHFQLGVIYESKSWKKTSESLQEVLNFQSPEPPTFTWKAAAYQQVIQKKLIKNDNKIRRLQIEIYQLEGNLQALPLWCYQASDYYFYFEDGILILRQAYLIATDFRSWLFYLGKINFSWLFPLVSQKEILLAVYQECRRLEQEYKNKSSCFLM